MTNATLDNKIENTEVILWQYDKAWNLIRLIESWNKMARVSCQYFWDRFWGNTDTFEKGTFFIDSADSLGLTIWGRMLGIPRPTISKESGTGEVEVTPISDDLYRRLLKARFFMMNHKPTVPNYNKFLTILWGAMRDDAIEYDTRKIFNSDGEPNKTESGETVPSANKYESRSKVFDFQDMTMGFSFPKDATDEEAYLIFQHPDIVYPYPAGIRYPGEFILDDMVIGLNNPDGSGQNYRNLVDGIILAEDDETGNPNGGILSTTDRANYTQKTKVQGTAFVLSVADGTLASLEVSNPTDTAVIVWVGWGDGAAEYYTIPIGGKTLSHTYTLGEGLVAVRAISNSVDIGYALAGAEKTFPLVLGGS